MKAKDGEGLPVVDLRQVDNPSLTLVKLVRMFFKLTRFRLFFLHWNPKKTEVHEKVLATEESMHHFCRIVRSSPEGRTRCTETHQRILKRRAESADGMCERCHAGLDIVHHPVIVRGTGGAGGLGGIQAVGILRNNNNHTPPEATMSAQGRGAGDPEDFGFLVDAVWDLFPPREEALDSFKETKMPVRNDRENIQRWLDIIATYLSEWPNSTLPREIEEIQVEEPDTIGSPVEQRIRSEIERFVTLPPLRGNRCCGCSPDVIDRVVVFLKKFFPLSFSTQVIAQALGFEPSYFGKTFKKHVGRSLTYHLRQVRLERAKKLLRNPYLSVQEIADRTGFSDASYFTRVFHLECGQAPKEYRDHLSRRGQRARSG